MSANDNRTIVYQLDGANSLVPNIRDEEIRLRRFLEGNTDIQNYEPSSCATHPYHARQATRDCTV